MHIPFHLSLPTVHVCTNEGWALARAPVAALIKCQLANPVHLATVHGGQPWWPCGLRRFHGLLAVSDYCPGLNPGLGKYGSCQWRGVRRWFSAVVSANYGFLHLLQLATHDLVPKWRKPKFQNPNQPFTNLCHLFLSHFARPFPELDVTYNLTCN